MSRIKVKDDEPVGNRVERLARNYMRTGNFDPIEKAIAEYHHPIGAAWFCHLIYLELEFSPAHCAQFSIDLDCC